MNGLVVGPLLAEDLGSGPLSLPPLKSGPKAQCFSLLRLLTDELVSTGLIKRRCLTVLFRVMFPVLICDLCCVETLLQAQNVTGFAVTSACFLVRAVGVHCLSMDVLSLIWSCMYNECF